MIRDRVRSGLYCFTCGGTHMSGDCQQKKSMAPLETPSHNGLYAGPCKVREIPSGVFGEDFKHKHKTFLPAKSYSRVCKNTDCKKPFVTPSNDRLYCCAVCKNHAAHLRHGPHRRLHAKKQARKRTSRGPKWAY